MMDDDELIEAGYTLYRKLGGIGSRDARIIRGIIERWQDRKIPITETDRLMDAAENILAIMKMEDIGEHTDAICELDEAIIEYKHSTKGMRHGV